jgi:hypothetical protein
MEEVAVGEFFRFPSISRKFILRRSSAGEKASGLQTICLFCSARQFEQLNKVRELWNGF